MATKKMSWYDYALEINYYRTVDKVLTVSYISIILKIVNLKRIIKKNLSKRTDQT